MTYLRPDSKSQVTIEYSDDNQPIRIEAIVVSTQHDEFVLAENNSESAKEVAEIAMQQQIENDVKNILIPRVLAQLEERQQVLFGTEKYHINPTGKFVIGGPHGDTGLTGRKIIVDTYAELTWRCFFGQRPIKSRSFCRICY